MDVLSAPEFLMVYDDGFTKYDVPPGYSFSGRRFSDFLEYFLARMPEDKYEILGARKATRKELMTVHACEYLDYVEDLANEIPGSFMTYLTPDTQVNRDMLEANKLIVGAAILAVDAVVERGLPVYTFGGLHHAGPSRGGGFCVLNDVAAAARHARSAGVERVMVLDTDAHAGDGTMDIFYQDPTVLTVSVHHDPTTFYPGRGFIDEIGEGAGEGFAVNCPMPPYAGIKCYSIFWAEILEPISREFKPDVIIRNGGSDPYVSDIQHLGYTTYLGLTKRDLHTLGEWVGDLRTKLGSSYVDTMGSGYNADSLPSCWYALMTGSLGIDAEIEDEVLPPKVDDEKRILKTEEVSGRLRKVLSPYWDSLQ